MEGYEFRLKRAKREMPKDLFESRGGQNVRVSLSRKAHLKDFPEIRNRRMGNGERETGNPGESLKRRVFKSGNLKNGESLKGKIFKMGNL